MLCRRNATIEKFGAARVLIFLILTAAILSARPTWAGPAFEITPPPGWTDHTTNLKPDMLRQIIGPNIAGLVEVYSYQIPEMGLERQADVQENAIRGLGLTYTERRLSSESVSLNGLPAIRRTYSGQYNGLPLKSVILFLYYENQAVLVQGISVVGSGLEPLTEQCVNSFTPLPSGRPAAPASAPTAVKPAAVKPAAAEAPATAPVKLTPPPPVKSALADPAALLLPDTRLDGALGGKTWETDAVLDRAEERKLAGGKVYRLAYASYVPVGEDAPEVDMQVYSGPTAVLDQIAAGAEKALGKTAGPGHFGAWCLRSVADGKTIIWFKKSGALLRVSAPDETLAAQLADLILK